MLLNNWTLLLLFSFEFDDNSVSMLFFSVIVSFFTRFSFDFGIKGEEDLELEVELDEDDVDFEQELDLERELWLESKDRLLLLVSKFLFVLSSFELTADRFEQ